MQPKKLGNSKVNFFLCVLVISALMTHTQIMKCIMNDKEEQTDNTSRDEQTNYSRINVFINSWNQLEQLLFLIYLSLYIYFNNILRIKT